VYAFVALVQMDSLELNSQVHLMAADKDRDVIGAKNVDAQMLL
jgi:hypothetical protein